MWDNIFVMKIMIQRKSLKGSLERKFMKFFELENRKGVIIISIEEMLNQRVNLESLIWDFFN